jgi:hypothetical protein
MVGLEWDFTHSNELEQRNKKLFPLLLFHPSWNDGRKKNDKNDGIIPIFPTFK